MVWWNMVEGWFPQLEFGAPIFYDVIKSYIKISITFMCDTTFTVILN